MPDREVHWYPPGPVARAFMRSSAFIVGIDGPIGSGKSTTAVAKLAKNAQAQTGGEDGVARRRTVIVRNTYPELSTTTIKSWHQWFPPECGDWRDKGPPRHLIRRYDSDRNLIFEWEVLFLALDQPKDVAHVLSLELSDAWVNEAREVPKAVIDGLTGRIGRFPRTVRENPLDASSPVKFGCVNPQLLMDTNKPDTDHWWYVLAERDTSSEHGRQIIESMLEAEEELRSLGLLARDQPLFEFFHQPGANDPGAENLQNLDPAYYIRAKAGKDDDWIKVYINACYGFVKDGKPVYPEYRDSLHARQFEIVRRLPLWIGLDFGLTPAAVFKQRMPNGRITTHSELCTERFGIKQFGRLLMATIHERYRDMQIGAITGDPAGNQGQGGGDDEPETVFQLLKAERVVAEAASTNDFSVRRESVAELFNQLIDGEPAYMVHAQNAPVLRKGYQGGYAFRRIQVAGHERYRDVPDKSRFSHPCEADQYGTMGMGEDKGVMRRDGTVPRGDGRGQKTAGTRFAIMD